MKYLLLLFLLAFTAIVGFSSARWLPDRVDPYSHHEPKGYLFVWVEGEVKKPGRYLVREGDKVKEIALLAEPFDVSLLKGEKWEKPVRSGQRIQVKKKRGKSEKGIAHK
jgi:hypothetical protein